MIQVKTVHGVVRSQAEEQIVGVASDHVPASVVDGRNVAVIEVVPPVVDRVLREGRIMAEASATHVIRDTEAVVDEAGRVFLFWHQHIRLHV